MRFLMIYIMPGYEKVDFSSARSWPLNDLQIIFRVKNVYRFLKNKLSAFQIYILCHDLKKLIFWHFLMYKLQNEFKLTLRVRMYRVTRKNIYLILQKPFLEWVICIWTLFCGTAQRKISVLNCIFVYCLHYVGGSTISV